MIWYDIILYIYILLTTLDIIWKITEYTIDNHDYVRIWHNNSFYFLLLMKFNINIFYFLTNICRIIKIKIITVCKQINKTVDFY